MLVRVQGQVAVFLTDLSHSYQISLSESVVAMVSPSFPSPNSFSFPLYSPASPHTQSMAELGVVVAHL